MTSFTSTLLAHVDMPEDVAIEAVALYGQRYGGELASNQHLGAAGAALARVLDDERALAALIASGNKWALDALLERGRPSSYLQLAVVSSWRLSAKDIVRTCGDDPRWGDIVMISEQTEAKRRRDEATNTVESAIVALGDATAKSSFGEGSGAWLDRELAGETREQTLSAWRWLFALGEEGGGSTLRELVDGATRLARA